MVAVSQDLGEDESEEDEVTFGSSYESEDDEHDDNMTGMGSEMGMTTMTVQNVQWKPKSDTTYETLVLTRSEFNSKVRGAGFR